VSGRVTARVREVGDSALVLEIGDLEPGQACLDEDVSRQVTAVARVVKRRGIPGVRDVLPTFQSVVVWFDPLSGDAAAIAAALHEGANAAPDAAGRVHTVPASYGGADGPDLEAVAEFAGCSADEVVARHTSRAYRVFMLGFLPGFAYMGSVDPGIAAPRLATPRLCVPAGSIGIAGQQTGIYPVDSPGGWRIVGRACVTPFDAERLPPSLFAAGDTVQFVAVHAGAFPDAGPRSPGRATRATADIAGHVTVLHPGLQTTVQDSGRWGYQDLGVPVSGPMDPVAHRLANVLVGNRRDAATLEVTWLGPRLRMEQDTSVALTGADLGATLDGADLPRHTRVTCRAGSEVGFGARRSGARGYVAFGGGIVTRPVLGSRATHVRSGLGGFSGRPLKSGDRLPLGHASGVTPRTPVSLKGLPTGGARLRVLRGPQAEYFTQSDFDALRRSRYTISAKSDRMGYRLTGGARVASSVGGTMLSDAAFVGGIQIPPSGDPLLLMADRPTTGGYPQIAVVISADLGVAAQLGPGDWVEFEACSRADAVAALVAQEGRLLAVR
jgi:KipI family sensor histidine kinase inhibitor